MLSGVLALAEGAALGRVAGRGARGVLLRLFPGRSIYLGPLAATRCCRKSRLLKARPLPHPLGPEATWLCLWARLVFRGARGSCSSGCCCTTARGWKLESAPRGPGCRCPYAFVPSEFPPRPQGSAAAAREQGPALGKSRPVLPQLPSWRGAIERGPRGVWVTAGQGWEGVSSPSTPELS